jgi:hypothetical protein
VALRPPLARGLPFRLLTKTYWMICQGRSRDKSSLCVDPSVCNHPATNTAPICDNFRRIAHPELRQRGHLKYSYVGKSNMEWELRHFSPTVATTSDALPL